MKKKLLCLALSLAIAVTMMPAMAFAGEAIDSYNLQIVKNAHGTVLASEVVDNHVSLYAHPKLGYKFNGFKVNGRLIKGNQVTLKKNSKVSAVFVKATPVSLPQSLKKKLANEAKLFHDSPKRAQKVVSYWLADNKNVYGLAPDLLAKSGHEKEMLDMLYIYSTVLDYSLNYADRDGIRCILDHMFPLKEDLFDILDATKAEDYEALGEIVPGFILEKIASLFEDTFGNEDDEEGFDYLNLYANKCRKDLCKLSKAKNIGDECYNYAKSLKSLVPSVGQYWEKSYFKWLNNYGQLSIEDLIKQWPYNLYDIETGYDDTDSIENLSLKEKNQMMSDIAVSVMETVALNLRAIFNGYDAVDEDYTDEFKCVVDRIFPLMYKYCDLLYAIENEYYADVIMLAVDTLTDMNENVVNAAFADEMGNLDQMRADWNNADLLTVRVGMLKSAPKIAMEKAATGVKDAVKEVTTITVKKTVNIINNIIKTFNIKR